MKNHDALELLKNLAASDCSSFELRGAMLGYMGVSVDELCLKLEITPSRYQLTYVYIPPVSKIIRNIEDYISDIISHAEDSQTLQEIYKTCQEKFQNEKAVFYNQIHNRPVGVKELVKASIEHGSHHVVLNYMRRYTELKVSKITGSKTNTTLYKKYYALNNEQAYYAETKANLIGYIDKIIKHAESQPNLNVEVLRYVGKRLLTRYEKDFQKKNPVAKALQKEVDLDSAKKALQDSKRERLLDIVKMDDSKLLLKALRTYFGLSFREITEILSSDKSLSNTLIQQWESKKFAFFIQPHRLLLLLDHYKTVAVNEPEEIRNILKPENFAFVKPPRKPNKSIFKFADENSDNILNYLGYLLIKAGHSNTTIIPKSTYASFGFNRFNKVIDLLLNPKPHGLDISSDELDRAQSMFYKYRREANTHFGNELNQNFSELVLNNITEQKQANLKIERAKLKFTEKMPMKNKQITQPKLPDNVGSQTLSLIDRILQSQTKGPRRR